MPKKISESIDLEYLHHFWNMTSKQMEEIIQKAIDQKRTSEYMDLLNDMLKKKKLQESDK